jgi:murein DD-endopeptidase MepM/ murein hydrolase activator NlpD
MKTPPRTPRLGIPWLGLPLSALLAWAAVGQTLWEPAGLAIETGMPAGAAFVVDAEGWRAPLELASAPRPRPAGRPADLLGEVRIGETLGGLFQGRLGLSSREAHAASTSSARFVELRQLRAGTPWKAYLDDAGRLDRFELELEGKGELTLLRHDAGWKPEWTGYRRETRILTVRGRIDGSLEASVERAGAPFELAYALAEVLQWDLDFSRDLQPGDEFRVLFEEVRVERSRPEPGKVLAVEYGRADGRRLEAYTFGDDGAGGYYDAEGRPLQKMFLRSPLPYSRVTSRFSHRRFHPVLGVFRPHYGVDYGAPTGTPVRVTASGTVVSAGWDGGGGRTVKVRHANDYLTAYLHLSRFAEGVRSGRRVRQGDVVGYVGSTGLATAPHLDYRIQQHGRWIDPLSLRSVPAQPISATRLAEFRAVRDAMHRSLESGDAYQPPPFTLLRDAQRVARGEAESAATGGRASGAT